MVNFQVNIHREKHRELADASKEKTAIDELVYQLNGLTEDEFRIMEGKNDG
jgi:hypothetical protein